MTVLSVFFIVTSTLACERAHLFGVSRSFCGGAATCQPARRIGRRKVSSAVDRGQTSEICEKQGKYSKGKVVTFTVQSSIVYQYSFDLLTFFELY